MSDYPPSTLRCRAFGCRENADDWTMCERCGRHAYHDGHLCGWIYPLRRAWWRLRRLARVPRCGECRRLIWPWRRFCSDRCRDESLPF